MLLLNIQAPTHRHRHTQPGRRCRACSPQTWGCKATGRAGEPGEGQGSRREGLWAALRVRVLLPVPRSAGPRSWLCSLLVPRQARKRLIRERKRDCGKRAARRNSNTAIRQRQASLRCRGSDRYPPEPQARAPRTLWPLFPPSPGQRSTQELFSPSSPRCPQPAPRLSLAGLLLAQASLCAARRRSCEATSPPEPQITPKRPYSKSGLGCQHSHKGTRHSPAAGRAPAKPTLVLGSPSPNPPPKPQQERCPVLGEHRPLSADNPFISAASQIIPLRGSHTQHGLKQAVPQVPGRGAGCRCEVPLCWLMSSLPRLLKRAAPLPLRTALMGLCSMHDSVLDGEATKVSAHLVRAHTP